MSRRSFKARVNPIYQKLCSSFEMPALASKPNDASRFRIAELAPKMPEMSILAQLDRREEQLALIDLFETTHKTKFQSCASAYGQAWAI